MRLEPEIPPDVPRRFERPWRLKRRLICTSMSFQSPPLPARTGASLRPTERRSAAGMTSLR
jgi:hypothetical protein